MFVATDEKNVALVTPSEMRVIDQLRKGRKQAKHIAEHAGITVNFVRNVLTDLVNVDFVIKNKKDHTYKLAPNVEFKTQENIYGYAVPQPKPREKKPIVATFQHKQLPKPDFKITEYKLTPDELAELKKESFKHVRYFQRKDGGYIINADYHRR